MNKLENHFKPLDFIERERNIYNMKIYIIIKLKIELDISYH